MSQTIDVVMSADDNFAIGLAGTVSSILNCFSRDRALRLFVLDGGITDYNKRALIEHWNDSRLAVEWVRVDRQLVSEYGVSDHVSDATYYRLLSAELLPREVDKFIFLDADLLVRRDLCDMWQEPIDLWPCLAVQDLAAPFVDSAVALEHEPGLRRILVNERPIPNYAALNLAATNPYFNGGVMVVNLDLWRRERLARRMLQALHDHRQHVLYWDQYALNVVLSGRWKALDPRWNQNSYIFRETKWLASNFCLKQCPTYASDPWIVHFNWLKPWQAQCAHPFAEEFLQFVRGSRWAASIQSPQTPLPSENVRARPARSSRGMVRFLRNQTRRLFGKSAA